MHAATKMCRRLNGVLQGRLRRPFNGDDLDPSLSSLVHPGHVALVQAPYQPLGLSVCIITMVPLDSSRVSGVSCWKDDERSLK